MLKVVLFVNSHKEKAVRLAAEIASCLEERGFEHSTFFLNSEIPFDMKLKCLF